MPEFFQFDGSNWTAQGSAGIEYAEGGTFFEASIDSNNFGAPSGHIEFVSYLLFSGSGSESSYGVMPSDAFTNGSFDPDLTSFITVSAVPEPSLPSRLRLEFYGSSAQVNAGAENL